MSSRPLTVAWFSYFPIEGLPDLPPNLRDLPRLHPAPWQRVLLDELEPCPLVRLHVLVLRKQFPADCVFERNGVTFHCLRTWGGLRASTGYWHDTIRIGRALRRIRPDVIHAWGTENGAALVASRLPYRAVVTMQGLLGWLGSVVPQSRYERWAAWLEPWGLRRAEFITAESRFAVDYLRTHYPRGEVFQVEHAPRWIFHRVERSPQTEPVRLLSVGSFSFNKGGDIMIRALHQLRQELSFELVVVGRVEPGVREVFDREIAAEVRGRTRFLDFLAAEAVADELARATFLLFPTRGDNSPNAVKEAVVAGVPVIASDIGGIPDHVVPDQNGVLFPAGSLPGCVEAIRRACRHPLLREGKVPAAALARARTRLSPSEMGRRFLEVYGRAAGRGGGPGTTAGPERP
jgi:glycosyltransferase involved in cell wall biosynthesis